MRVVIPYVPQSLKPETAAWGEEHGAIFADVSVSESAYWETIAGMWGGDDLVIVEHDVVPPKNCLESFSHCKVHWCVCPYPVGRPHIWLSRGLGCVRFSAALQKGWPELIQAAAEPYCEEDIFPPRSWQIFDSRIAYHLNMAGLESHCHQQARHLQEYGPVSGNSFNVYGQGTPIAAVWISDHWQP